MEQLGLTDEARAIIEKAMSYSKYRQFSDDQYYEVPKPEMDALMLHVKRLEGIIIDKALEGYLPTPSPSTPPDSESR